MTNYLRRVLSRPTDAGWQEPPVHFHPGPHGKPVVCEQDDCSRPHLDPRDAGLGTG